MGINLIQKGEKLIQKKHKSGLNKEIMNILKQVPQMDLMLMMPSYHSLINAILSI